jgi:hypothetical protein
MGEILLKVAPFRCSHKTDSCMLFLQRMPHWRRIKKVKKKFETLFSFLFNRKGRKDFKPQSVRRINCRKQKAESRKKLTINH